MFSFSKTVECELINAGWYQGRLIEFEEIKGCLLNDGYVWFECVEVFLREFGGLDIEINVKSKRTDLLHFNVCKAVRDIDPRWVLNDYSIKLNNNKLCIIGQVFSNHMTLFMDNNKKVYGGYDDLLYFIANTGEEAIENICKNDSLSLI